MRYDTIILGSGPAGLTAARYAARMGKRVLVLDKAPRPGAKLLLAGGGKGNLTNRCVSMCDYVGEDTAFAAHALERVSPEAVCSWLQEAGIPFEEREYGRVFSAVSAAKILQTLLGSLPEDRCLVRFGVQVNAIRHENGEFLLTSSGHDTVRAPCLVMATGSPAWPQCGADDSGLRLAGGLGHRIVPVRPILVPFVMPSTWHLHGLTGISLPVRIGCDLPHAPAFTDSLLFTHKGLSGPAVLQTSCWWRKGTSVTIDFLPGDDVGALLNAATGKATAWSVLSRRLPDRLVAALCEPAIGKRRVAELSRRQRDAIVAGIHRHTVTPLRTEGMAKAEAAAGGVDTAEVDPLTMQSLRVPGLFFCGEMVDITGRLGGYNLHWAWASGTVAGEGAGR